MQASHNGARPAGLSRRLAALAYDSLLLMALWFCATWLLVLVRGGTEIPPGTWWYGCLLIVTSFLFFAGFWIHGGQTLGMRAWKIRVERDDGQALRWRDAFVRYFIAIIGLLALGIGFLGALVDPQRRCWHDRVSRTRLVRVDR